MHKLGHAYARKEWRFFIDSSTSGLKGVLLHNGNRKPSVPIAHEVYVKETYENTRFLMGKVMQITRGIYAQILNLSVFYLECNVGIPNTVASYVNGTVEPEDNITLKRTGHNEIVMFLV